MNITSERAGDAVILYFCGAADATAVEQIRRALGQGLGATCCRVVCDLSGTDFVCSDALGAFISAHEGAREAGGFVRLVHPQQRIADILATTQLNRLFQIYDTVHDALRE